MLLMPIIALVLSSLFEDFHLTADAMIGIALVLAGNLIILTPQTTYHRIKSRFKDRHQVTLS
jgi:drug/metabolite transporter (DMT)-like permease